MSYYRYNSNRQSHGNYRESCPPQPCPPQPCPPQPCPPQPCPPQPCPPQPCPPGPFPEWDHTRIYNTGNAGSTGNTGSNPITILQTNPDSITGHAGDFFKLGFDPTGTQGMLIEGANLAIFNSSDNTTGYGPVLALGNYSSQYYAHRGNVSIGDEARGIGERNFILGSYNTSLGSESYILGLGNSGIGNSNYIFGKNNKVLGLNNFSLGADNTISTSSSYALGADNTISGSNSYTFGTSLIVPQTMGNTYVFGNNNSADSTLSGYLHSNQPNIQLVNNQGAAVVLSSDSAANGYLYLKGHSLLRSHSADLTDIYNDVGNLNVSSHNGDLVLRTKDTSDIVFGTWDGSTHKTIARFDPYQPAPNFSPEGGVNNLNLGTASSRWAKIYSVDGDFSNDLTIQHRLITNVITSFSGGIDIYANNGHEIKLRQPVFLDNEFGGYSYLRLSGGNSVGSLWGLYEHNNTDGVYLSYNFYVKKDINGNKVNVITHPGGSTSAIRAAYGKIIFMASSTINTPPIDRTVLEEASFRPVSGTSINLGQINERWENIFGKNGHFNGNVIIDGANSTTKLIVNNNANAGVIWVDTSNNDVYTAQTVITPSDSYFKEDIQNLDENFALKLITLIKPKTYFYKGKSNGKRNLGLIAQDLEETLTDEDVDPSHYNFIVKYDEEGLTPQLDKEGNPQLNQDGTQVMVGNGVFTKRYGVRYTEFITPMITVMKKLINENNQLKTDITDIKARLDVLENP